MRGAHGPRSGHTLAHSVRLRRQFPHHLSLLHDWARRLAGNPRGDAAGDRNPIYRRVFDFWLKVFALSFGMGVVTGIVMAFQFGGSGPKRRSASTGRRERDRSRWLVFSASRPLRRRRFARAGSRPPTGRANRKRFQGLTDAGYTAAKRTGKGTSELIGEFDPTARETLFMPRLVGG
jgi:hypothetical protein